MTKQSMSIFSSVFARDYLQIQNESPRVEQIINYPLSAEFFFATYWQHKYQTPVTLPITAINKGWDFKTDSHFVEVKTCTGQVSADSIRFQINKLQHKTDAWLCTLYDTPGSNYCVIGMAIPPAVWVPLMSDSGRISITMTADYKWKINRPEVRAFASYHTIMDKVSLSSLIHTFGDQLL